MQPSLILTVKARAKSTLHYVILHVRNTRACNAARTPRARMLSVPCIITAQQTHCGSPHSKADSIELSYMQRVELRGYLRPQLEGRYRQNAHRCLAMLRKKREAALLW